MNGSNNKWFKRKTYGYGWTPAAWQGWVTLLMFVVVNVLNILRLGNSVSDRERVVAIISVFVITTAVLIYLCIKKGEPAKWQWGEKGKEKTDV